MEPVSQLFANVESPSLCPSTHPSICPPWLWGRVLVLTAGARDVCRDPGMEKAVGGEAGFVQKIGSNGGISVRLGSGEQWA